MIPICKTLQEAVNLLRLLWQLHLHQEFPDSHINGITEEREPSHILPQGSLIEVIV